MNTEVKAEQDKKLRDVVDRIDKLNKFHYDQLREERIVIEQNALFKNKVKSYCVLWPKESVSNPFVYESY